MSNISENENFMKEIGLYKENSVTNSVLNYFGLKPSEEKIQFTALFKYHDNMLKLLDGVGENSKKFKQLLEDAAHKVTQDNMGNDSVLARLYKEQKKIIEQRDFEKAGKNYFQCQERSDATEKDVKEAIENLENEGLSVEEISEALVKYNDGFYKNLFENAELDKALSGKSLLSKIINNSEDICGKEEKVLKNFTKTVENYLNDTISITDSDSEISKQMKHIYELKKQVHIYELLSSKQKSSWI